MDNDNHLHFEGKSVGSAPTKSARFLRRVGTASSHPPEQFDQFIAWLFTRANLDARKYRSRVLARRLPACLRDIGANSVEDARAMIEKNPSLVESALNVILLGVTQFCRDSSVFDVIEKKVLPDLLKAFKRIRIWSAACSDGQELYSVAMLLHDRGRLGDCEMLGTDFRRRAIDQAGLGVFNGESVAKMDPRHRNTYFVPERRALRADSSLRSALRWKVADLNSSTEPGPWQMILWRNMAIYLKPEAAEHIWTSLAGQLHPGGYLITGKAEHPPAWLMFERIAACIYRKK